MSHRALSIAAIVTMITALCFLILPYMFFPQFYIPKAEASMGYLLPTTTEGWVFLIIGLSLIGLAVFFRVKKNT